MNLARSKSASPSRIPLWRLCLAIGWLVLVLITGLLAQGATVWAFGPKTYTRDKSEARRITDFFQVTNTKTAYRVSVDNQGVASAVISLNGQLIFTESDFDPNVTHLAKTVILLPRNELEVELRGKPGSSLTVQISVVTSATTLNVHAFRYDPALADGKGPALGAGVQIQINGTDAGVTNGCGLFSSPVTPGALNLVGKLPSQAVGSANTTISAGQSLDIDLLLDYDKEATENPPLTAEEVTNQLLNTNFLTLTLRFIKDGAPVPIKTIDSMDLLNGEGTPVSEVEKYFSVDTQGVIRGADIRALQSLFQDQQGIMTLRVMASDVSGLVYQNGLSFYLARFNISGALVAPPSFPDLNTAGIQVGMTLLGTPLTLSTISGPGGAFTFPRLPAGSISLNSSTEQQGKFYYGEGQLALNRSVSVSLVMRNQNDVKNGVPPLIVKTALVPLQPSPDVASSARFAVPPMSQCRPRSPQSFCDLP
jgi:hypothetical protein